MKKLFLVISMLVLGLVLAGCSEEGKLDTYEITVEFVDEAGETTSEAVSYEEGYEGTLLDLLELNFVVVTEEASFGAFLVEIDSVTSDENSYIKLSKNGEASLVGIEEMTFEDGDVFEFMLVIITVTNTLSFEFEDVDGNLESFNVNYDGDYEGSFTDLITEHFTVTTLASDYGTLLLSINDVIPFSGSYIAISKNDEMSSVGIDDIVFADGDKFTFTFTWWDQTAANVYISIDRFIENQASSYVNTEFIDYNVLMALELLGITEEYITDEEIFNYASTTYPNPVTYTDFFKQIMMYHAAGETDAAQESITALKSVATTGIYGQTAYTLIALDSINYGTNSIDYISDAMGFFDSNAPGVDDLDVGAMSILALAGYEGLATDLVSQFKEELIATQLETGGFKTADTVWGDTTYPGTENAATMASIIIGLIANGIDPVSTFTVGNTNPVLRLTYYQTETGLFDWNLSDDIEDDAAFSTPQAFLALVSYFVYSNTYEAVNPYNFD